MARKRQTARQPKANKDAGAEEGKPVIAFTLEQALAELERLTPWSRNLPICKSLLQSEICRLRADGSSADKAPERSAPATDEQNPPAGLVSRESSDTDAGKLEATRGHAYSEAADAQQAALGQEALAEHQHAEHPGAHVQPHTAETTVPEHWDFEEEAVAGDSNYLDGSIDCPPEADEATEHKAQLKIRIPVEEYPGYNFIGRLLGPRGATLKQLETQSKCRLYIRGRGSLRSSGMGQELARASLPGFEHLNEDLHVLVEFEGDASERDKCLSIASKLVAPLLVPPASDDQDELKKQQLKELAILNGTYKENKLLMPVANKRIAATAAGGAGAGSNLAGVGVSEAQQQHTANSQAGCSGGMGPHVTMMQVMAQQMFMQEQQHKLNLRIGLQHAQQAHQAMTARQQTMSAQASNSLFNANKNANTPVTNFPHTNVASSFGSSQHQHHQMGNFIGCATAAGGVVGTSGMNRNSLNAMGGVYNGINGRSQSNAINIAGGRAGLVTGDAKPFVPTFSAQAVDAKPFFPSSIETSRQQQQQQRGRNNTQCPPQPASFSQGPPPMHSGNTNVQRGMYAHTPNKGKGRQDKSPRDENSDPQWAASKPSTTGAKGPSSPSFLTSMQTPAQAGIRGNFSRTESYSCGNVLDNSVDIGWGSSLPFDLGWEGGDNSVDSSFNSSFTAGATKAGSRSSPPGGRGAQRWHPYSRSPPKTSPDFTSKVVAICTASFGGHSGQQGAYSLF